MARRAVGGGWLTACCHRSRGRHSYERVGDEPRIPADHACEAEPGRPGRRAWRARSRRPRRQRECRRHGAGRGQRARGGGLPAPCVSGRRCSDCIDVARAVGVDAGEGTRRRQGPVEGSLESDRPERCKLPRGFDVQRPRLCDERPDHRARDRAELLQLQVPSLRRCGGRRHLAHRQRALPLAELDVRLRRTCDERDRRDHARPGRRDGQHALRGNG